MKRYAPFIVLIVVALVVLWALESRRKKEIDWTPTYNRKDRIPLGTYILSEVLPQIFPGQNIAYVNQPPYELAMKQYPKASNFILIGNRVDAGEADFSQLAWLANQGHSIFISTNTFNKRLLDTLDLKVEHNVLGTYASNFYTVEATLQTRDTNAVYSFPVRRISAGHFTQFEGKGIQVLGKLNGSHVYFLRVPFGKGFFYLHTLPDVFANQCMVRDGIYPLAGFSLAQLKLRPVYWNDYFSINNEESNSILRFLMSSPALRWAWYLLLSGIVLFIILEGKRKQRIQPIILPLANTTLEFAQTIGRLFYHQHDHRNIARKRILYFYETLRNKLFLRREGSDSEFFERFAQKAGISADEAATFFKSLDQFEKSHAVGANDLVRLANELDDMYFRLGLRKPAIDALLSGKN